MPKFLIACICLQPLLLADEADWQAIAPDLSLPAVEVGKPAPGKRIRHSKGMARQHSPLPGAFADRLEVGWLLPRHR